MRNASWTEAEQMKVVWNIIKSEILVNTEPRTQKRKQITDTIIAKLKVDPDFSERLKTEDPERTINQHIQAWIGYLENRRGSRPPIGK